ncbi:MAG TPA: hypothetical protein VIR60_07190 [Gammaproteobacteria bacterium]
MRLFSWLLVSVLFAGGTRAAGAAGELRHDSDRLTVVLTPRTPDQMAAFYTARGFGRVMIDRLSAQCFITVFIANKSADIVWLDLGQWRFGNAGGTMPRHDRNYWREQWNQLQIPLAHQSTFRWTLLPERLDFRPGEAEGGNIILPRLDKDLTITARFATGADRAGTPIEVEFEKVRCAEDP